MKFLQVVSLFFCQRSILVANMKKRKYNKLAHFNTGAPPSNVDAFVSEHCELKTRSLLWFILIVYLLVSYKYEHL